MFFADLFLGWLEENNIMRKLWVKIDLLEIGSHFTTFLEKILDFWLFDLSEGRMEEPLRFKVEKWTNIFFPSFNRNWKNWALIMGSSSHKRVFFYNVPQVKKVFRILKRKFAKPRFPLSQLSNKKSMKKLTPISWRQEKALFLVLNNKSLEYWQRFFFFLRDIHH